MVAAQGGDATLIEHPERFERAKCEYTVKAPRDGYIVHVDTEGYGTAALLLGAGRNTMEDKIDFAAGIHLIAKTGDFVHKGDDIATLYASNKALFAAAERRLLDATEIGDELPAEIPLILERVE